MKTTLEAFLRGDPIDYLGANMKNKLKAKYEGKHIIVWGEKINFQTAANEVEASRFYHQAMRGTDEKVEMARAARKSRSRRR